MRKICVVTATRAEFGILTPVMKEIENHPELSLSIIVTGMHLSKDFGYTIENILEEGFIVEDEIPILEKSDSSSAMVRSIGKALIGLSRSFEKTKPDIVLLLGDRIEMLAAVIAAVYMNIITAHLHGGESSGTVDDLTRNAISKYSSIHLPATEKSRKLIENMNESSENIFVVGAPGLDPIYAGQYATKEEVVKELKINPNEELILVVQHSNTFEVEQSSEQIRETLEAIVELKKQCVLIYPNSDAGGRTMIKTIKEYEDLPYLFTFKNLSREYYLGLMALADVIVGNSSSGIIEASAFGLPVVNIGTRQRNRERADYIIDVDYNKKEIIEAIRYNLTEKSKKKAKMALNPYGKGDSCKRIVNILAEIQLSDKLLEKYTHKD